MIQMLDWYTPISRNLAVPQEGCKILLGWDERAGMTTLCILAALDVFAPAEGHGKGSPGITARE